MNESGAKEFLTANNWPEGLQQTGFKAMAKFPIRFMIIDDSGSMGASDGHKLVKSGDKAV